MKDQIATTNDTNTCCDNTNISCCVPNNQQSADNHQAAQTLDNKTEPVIKKATIDGQEVIIVFEDINNVCCNTCVVEIDCTQNDCCSEKPKHGINIVVNREELIKLRKERVNDYKNATKNNQLNLCSCISDCC